MFAPIDESFADDALLLPSGFRVIPLDPKSVEFHFFATFMIFLELGHETTVNYFACNLEIWYFSSHPSLQGYDSIIQLADTYLLECSLSHYFLHLRMVQLQLGH